jgi:hypothetical protein
MKFENTLFMVYQTISGDYQPTECRNEEHSSKQMTVLAEA